MKNLKCSIIAMLLFTAIPMLNAQNDDNNDRSDDEIVTLMGNSNHIGGYGALSIRYFGMDDRDGVMFGARGGIIVGHGISFGLTGTGFVTQPVYDPIIGEDAMLVGGYGGIYIEPIILPRFPVHIALPLTIGGGGIGYNITRHNYGSMNNNWDENYTDERGFLLIEPGIEVEFNIMRHFRLAVGGSYKFTSDIELHYNNSSNYSTRIIPRNALQGATVGVTFKFGSF